MGETHFRPPGASMDFKETFGTDGSLARHFTFFMSNMSSCKCFVIVPYFHPIFVISYSSFKLEVSGENLKYEVSESVNPRTTTTHKENICDFF